MYAEEMFVTWVAKPHTCPRCGEVKVRETKPGKPGVGTITKSYTSFVCPDKECL